MTVASYYRQSRAPARGVLDYQSTLSGRERSSQRPRSCPGGKKREDHSSDLGWLCATGALGLAVGHLEGAASCVGVHPLGRRGYRVVWPPEPGTVRSEERRGGKEMR